MGSGIDEQVLPENPETPSSANGPATNVPALDVPPAFPSAPRGRGCAYFGRGAGGVAAMRAAAAATVRWTYSSG